ncbi:MAG: glycosyltransferase family 4 protein [Cyanobacteriota bacterium]|jgi:glycosyltransferase involved in cell wall biosynthesis
MRILQVNHQFPPFSSQGSEVYCRNLSLELAAGGDAVAVFHISNTQPARPRRLEQGNDHGISTFHCIDAGEYGRQADWPNRFLVESFASVLRQFRPEIVHFHNYLSLGDDLVGLAASGGAAVVYTLHDYGLICPNNLLLRSDGSLCGKSDPDFFEACCPQMLRVVGGGRPLVAARVPSLARWRTFAESYPHPRRRMLLRAAVGVAERLLGHPLVTDVPAKRSFFFSSTRRIFTGTDLFIAPSDYLRQRFVGCGLPAERVVHIRYGMAHFQRAEHQPAADGRLRFGYIGAFHAHKGIAVLIEAFQGLGDRASLHLHGSSFGSPVSEAHFRRFTADPGNGVVVHGRYDNARIGELLAGLDAIIVPSIWYENSPLTIQEAQIAGVPVITGAGGGMAELVRDGVDGRLFRIGDAADLRRVLLDLIERPDQLAQLRAQAPAVPTIAAQSRLVREQYLTLLERPIGSRRPSTGRSGSAP